MPRRKIEIKKIEDRAKLYTTFTKRRKGLFNKASEYCKLFNAEAAMVVYSNSGNLFMWGHPNEEKVINDYLRSSSSSSSLMNQDDEDAAAGPSSSSSSSDQTERGDEAQEEEQASGSAQEEEEEAQQELTESAEIDENLKEIKDWLQVVKEKKKERKAISMFRGNAESEFFLRL